MEKIPSAFNDLWDFLFTPLIEFFILLLVLYIVADKTSLKSRADELFRSAPTRFQLLKSKIAEPLGLSGLIGIGSIIIIITIIVASSRISHLIGEVLPGSISYEVESTMIGYSDFGPYAKVWASHPEIEDVHQLCSYVTSVIAKDSAAYPDIASSLKWSKEQFYDVINWQNFEKFLLVYVIIILPLLCKLLKVKAKSLIVKTVLLTCLIFFVLTINFYNGYRAIKRMSQNNSYACQIVMAEQISKIKNSQANPFIKKLLEYNKYNRGWRNVFLHFDTFLEL